MEGGKRGRRKSGEVFAPHPQILKKLASVYHVPAYELLERAGYLEDERAYVGFSEEQELDRCFDFVIHDPTLKRALTVYEKRAVIQRYETLTGRKLITWSDDESALDKKTDFSGLQCVEGMLYANTIQKTLTAEELARELRISHAELKVIVENRHLTPKGDSKKDWVFTKRDVQSFKTFCLESGVKLLQVRDRHHVPKTEEDTLRALEEVQEAWAEPARQRLKERLAARKQVAEASEKKGENKTS